MEIDDDLHANFYGIAGPEHLRLHLRRGHEPGIYPHSRDFSLSPGEWIFNDSDATYSNDSLWMYSVNIIGICNSVLQFLVPGAILNVAENRNNNWFLEIKTILQNNGGFYASRKFVYFIYTIDEYGNRHLFQDQNGPIVLHYETTSWQIPGPHIDPYYQCGVGRQLDDGSYVLLSLSNKVPNPWPDIDGLDEQENKKSFSIFPNPANGMFTVEGKGQMRVCNLFGQIILTKEIDGQMTLELPPGMYFVNIDGTTRKVLVE